MNSQKTVCPAPVAMMSLALSSRYSSTFTNMSLGQLWDGCSGVSNAGKKKGRGKRGSSKRVVNIHLGKRLGYSKHKKYIYPGLNANVLVGDNERVKMAVLEKEEGEDETLLALRDKFYKFARTKRFPLERGWSGAKLPGISAGVPDPHNEYNFDGFDSRILEFKTVSHMTGNLGRKHSFSALVVVGNGKGLVGTAVAKSSLGQPAIRKAKNTAAQRLQYVNLKENRTIWHDFHVKIGATRLIATPKPEGYGLVCHRAIRTIAQCVGIKDLYCKVEGRTKNIQNVAGCFLQGLLNMETHQNLADKTNYYVVELSPKYNVPSVLAEPSDGAVKEEPLEHFDLKRHYMDGKTLLRKGRKVRFYERLNSYHMQKINKLKFRNQHKLAIQRQASSIELM